jgi:hypothetical protein
LGAVLAEGHLDMTSMNRRGFFSSLFQSKPTRFFLGVQIAITTLSDEATPRALQSLMRRAATLAHPHEKRAFYKSLAAQIMEQQAFWEYGFWSYILDTDDACTEFEQWIAELSANMATESDELASDTTATTRINTEKYYVVLTVCFLLECAPTIEPVEHILEELADTDEADVFTRSGFARLLDAIARIDFQYCERDAVFVMPGNDEDGFSWEDLHGAGWEYLRPITW